MNAIKTSLKKYYRQISKELICPQNEKKKILADIKSNVTCYLEENPDADFDGVQAHFGTPGQISAAYIGEIDTPEIIRKLKIRNRIVTTVCIAVGVCVLLWAASVVIALIDSHQSANLIIESYITEE